MKLLRLLFLFALGTSTFPSFADHPSVGMPGSLSSPIITTSAGLLETGQRSASVEYQAISFDAIDRTQLTHATEQGEDIHSTDDVFRLALNLAYGFSDNLTLGISVPFVRREGIFTSLHHHDDEAQEHENDHGDEENHEHEMPPGYASLGDSEGFGDINLYALYQLSNTDFGKTALVVGVKTPTGNTHQKDAAGQNLEVELQPGSGSWDPFLGASWSTTLGNWSVDSNILYKLSTEGADHTELGDIANYNLALSTPLSIHDHSSHQHSHNDDNLSPLSLVMEINGEWTGKTEINGKKSVNSGGHIVYFSPGITVAADPWLLSASIGIPYASLNGLQAKPNTRFLLRLGRNFH